MVSPALITPVASSGSFLISPSVGLMVWTLLLFALSMIILWKLAFPRITEALDRRQHAIEESIDHAERIRHQADEILAEYRERLKEARGQAEEIIERARKAGEVHERESEAEAKARRSPYAVSCFRNSAASRANCSRTRRTSSFAGGRVYAASASSSHLPPTCITTTTSSETRPSGTSSSETG
jgi:vacuolar-type H+-ATPase subunit H